MTYALTSPGGSWDGDDVGDYLATLVAAEVTDTAGTPVTAGALGGFRVLIGRTLVVTNAADSGPGSLRAALAEAGRITPSTDSVTFDPAFFGTARTILLTSGQLGASDSVAIVGPGAALLTIDGGGVHRGMQFSAAAAGTLDVSNSGLTVTNCTSGGKGTVGGAIYFLGRNLAIADALLVSNAASAGGAVQAYAKSLEIRDTRVINNKASNEVIYSPDGGGVATNAQVVVLRRCHFAGNSSNRRGGAIYIGANTSSVTVDASTLSGNFAGTGPGLRWMRTAC